MLYGSGVARVYKEGGDKLSAEGANTVEGSGDILPHFGVRFYKIQNIITS